jgi:hypothetical protein
MHFSRTGRWREVVWGLLASVMFALAFSYPILTKISGLGLDHDWDLTMEMHWAPFYTIAHFHQFPFWDPYKCGGLPLLGNPQSRILTPFLFLHLLFGPLIGMHLEIIGHLAIGFGGAYFLARVVNIGKLGALSCGATFAGSSWYYIHMAPGHSVFLCIMYVPWAVAFFWLGWRERKLTFAAPTGLIATLIFFEGGIYQTTHLALVLAVLAVALAVQYRSWFPLSLLTIAGIFAVAFSAPKFLPTVHFLGLNPRSVDAFEVNSLSMFVQELFSRNQFFSRDSMGGFWGFWELGAYIDPFFGAMAILAMVFRFRSALPWSITTLVLLALAAGNHGTYSPWVLIHSLPIISGEHAPTRILMLLTIVVGVLAGLGVDLLCSLKKPWLTAAVAIMILLAMVDCWMVSSYNLRYMLAGGNPTPYEPTPVFQQYYERNDNRMFMLAISNHGAVNCYESAYSWGRNAHGANEDGYRGEQYLVGSGTLGLARWTPNRLDYDIDARARATLIINQNYDSDWKIVQGTGEVFKSNGLLAVRVPAGKQRLELRYSSPSFVTGCFIFLLGIGAAISIHLAERNSPSASVESPESSRDSGADQSATPSVESTEAPESQVENAQADKPNGSQDQDLG